MPDILSSIEAFAASEEGAPLVAMAFGKAQSLASNILGGLIATEIQNNKDATEQEIVDNVDGDLWHMARRKLGFLGFTVDILRSNQTYDGPLRSLIAAELAQRAVNSKSNPT